MLNTKSPSCYRFCFFCCFLDRRQSGSKKTVFLVIRWLVGWLVTVFSETVLRIFLIFCMKLGDYKGRKVTARFLKKILDLRDICEVSKLAQNQTLWYLVGWLVGNAVFSEMALRIFLIFCMKLGTIRAEKWQSRIFENSWFGDIGEKVSKLAQNQTLWYFSQKTALTTFLFLA